MADKKVNDMSFLEHLEELRWHLVRSILAIMVFAVAAFIFKDFIFSQVILAPKSPEFFTNRMFCALGNMVNIQKLCINSNPFQVINTQMAGQFMTHMMISIIVGIIVAFPYIFYEFWRFLRPALYSKERQHARGAVFYSSFLFILGILFGYYLIVPLSVNFLGSYSVSEEVTSMINLRSYINTVASISLASGIIFELPVLVYFLTKIGLVSPEFLKKNRRHSFIVILTLSAIITPPDIFSQIMVCFPLVFLYEIGISISRNVIKKEEARLAGDDDVEETEQPEKTENPDMGE